MKKILLIAFLFSFSIINAATYYISTIGSDISGNGTISSPWRTLYKATSTITSPGNIIHVNSGTYLETQTSILAPGVSIEGDGVTSVLKSTLTADWVEVLRLNSPEGTNGNQHISNVKFDGQNLSTFWGITVFGRSNVSIHDITMVDYEDRGILFQGRNDNLDGPPTIYSTGNTFYNNYVDNCAAYNGSNGIYGRGCLNIGGQEGMLIYNNTIKQDSRPIGYNGWPIKYANDGWTKGCKIYNNTLIKIPFTGAWGGDTGWDFAIELFNQQGLEIYSNNISGGSIDLNEQTSGGIYTYGTWIHDNYISLPTLSSSNNDGIILEFNTTNSIIENNTIDKMSNGIFCTPRPGNVIKNLTIRRNLFIHCNKNVGNGTNASWINFCPDANTYYLDGIYIYNNTFLSDQGNRPWWGIELGNNVSPGTSKNIFIRNNIMSGAHASFLTGDGNMSSIIVTHNDTYGNGLNDPAWWGTQPFNYLYTNNIHTDPLFSTNNTLLSSSPCINAGIDVGLPFNGTAPDIGYREYFSALPIKLYEFVGLNTQDGHLLKWQTSSEVNSSYFDIQISSDGVSYKTINRVYANGYPSTYSTINNNFGTISYYRLLMVDKNNISEYSNVITLKNSSKFVVNFTKNNLYLMFNSSSSISSNISIIDAMGRLVFNKNVKLTKGSNIMNLSLPLLSSGVYYVIVGSDRVSNGFIIN